MGVLKLIITKRRFCMENDNNRRKFIKNVGIGAAALGTAGLAGVLSSCKGQKQEEQAVK
ncbi:MAG: twin-arginine translocation signal domain-containing protein, partial [Proteobacteria bacterium]|nr:twin-arginine translocation signal domain-containing protein [Pseudomonadota bacterium]